MGAAGVSMNSKSSDTSEPFFDIIGCQLRENGCPKQSVILDSTKNSFGTCSGQGSA